MRNRLRRPSRRKALEDLADNRGFLWHDCAIAAFFAGNDGVAIGEASCALTGSGAPLETAPCLVGEVFEVER
ncbi:MAG: hypothetical protein AAF368_14680, partial [Planctomycetota bacterium]